MNDHSRVAIVRDRQMRLTPIREWLSGSRWSRAEGNDDEKKWLMHREGAKTERASTKSFSGFVRKKNADFRHKYNTSTYKHQDMKNEKKDFYSFLWKFSLRTTTARQEEN